MGAMAPPNTGLGKRKKKAKDDRKERAKDRPKAADSAARPVAPAATPGGASPDLVLEERGAFAFGSCDKCGWRGPARRSRDRARKDLAHHLDDKPKHVDHVAVTGG